MTTSAPKHSDVRSDNYILSRDKSEAERLDNQHKYLTTLLYESRLLYDRSVQLEPGSQVLDSGTGTGIWLRELSKQVPPTVDLFGVDLSAINFPEHHAANINFRVASVINLPKEWSDKFDFVNQRLLMGGLRTSEWPVNMSELYRVLKPGGHIQLMEMDFAHDVNAGPATKRVMGFYAELSDKIGLLLEGSNRLEGLLKEAGFANVKSEKKYLVAGKAWGRMGELGKQNLSQVFRTCGPAFMAHGVIGSKEELETNIGECIEEWDSAEEGHRVIAHIAIARKPVEL